MSRKVRLSRNLYSYFDMECNFVTASFGRIHALYLAEVDNEKEYWESAMKKRPNIFPEVEQWIEELKGVST